MSETGMRGEVVLHPRIQEKLREIETLRRNLAVLIEEREGLLYGQRDILLAQYNRDVGHLEHALFRLETGIAELRRRLALLQADVNLGRSVTPDRIVRLDEEIRQEFEQARAEIEERERALRESSLLLDPDRWMKPEDMRELKDLYRRLCQRYHPDVGGQDAERWEQIWSALQHAYRAGDLELLRALSETVGIPGKTLPRTPDGLDAEIGRLRSRIEIQRGRIARMLSEPPFSHREKLNDPQWIRARQEELKGEIAAREERRAQLRLRYEALLPVTGSVH